MQTPAKSISTLKKETNYIIPSLDRALSIMEILSEHPEGLNITEISSALKIPVNSAFRITATMHSRGFLERDPKSKSYNLTNKVTRISHKTISHKSLTAAAFDDMKILRDETKETILFGTLIGHQGVVLEQALGIHNFKFSIDLGTRFSLHTAAPGKAILSLMPIEDRDPIIAQIEFTPYTPNTITSAQAFIEHLDEVRQQGFAVDCDEEMEGQRCIGAAILDERDYPIGAIWLTGPSNRIPKREFKHLGQLCAKHAKSISQKLQH